MSSPLEEARKKISKDELREGLKLVEEVLGELGMEESVRRGYQNMVTVFLARYNRVQKERSIRTPEYYDMQLNSLATDMLELIELVEEEVGKRTKAAVLEINDTKFLTELVVDIDFGGKREEQLEEFLTSLATMIRINPGSLIAINKKSKNVIVEGPLSTEDVLKIKSLVRIGLLEELKSIKGYGEKEEWMKESAGVYLVDCKLPNIQLPGADLNGADLNGADLSGTDLNGVNLIGVNLSGAKLDGANLFGADLNGADLNGADLVGVILERANLRGAKLRNSNLNRANLKGANLRWADLKLANLSINNRKILGSNTLTAAIINQSWANLSRLNLTLTVLRGADLHGADLRGADLHGADLHGADLYGADLRGIDLHGADLHGAEFRGAIFLKNQAPMLIEMKVNISEVFFVNEQLTGFYNWISDE